MKFFQRPLPTTDRDSLRAPNDRPDEPNFWTSLLPSGVRFTHGTYVLAGADVGDYSQISDSLTASAAPYVSTMETIAAMP